MVVVVVVEVVYKQHILYDHSGSAPRLILRVLKNNVPGNTLRSCHAGARSWAHLCADQC